MNLVARVRDLHRHRLARHAVRRRLRFFEVQPGSPAAAAGLQSGDAISRSTASRASSSADSSILTRPADEGRRDGDARPSSDADGAVVCGDGRAPRPADQVDDGHGRPRHRRRSRRRFEAASSGRTAATCRPRSRSARSRRPLVRRDPRRASAQLVGQVATTRRRRRRSSGPVGIATQIGDVFFSGGPIMTLYVAGILSANLALVNILPFPPLDGGRMLMIVLKAIFGTRISLRAERLTYVVGFVFLFAFLIWVSGFDIVRDACRRDVGHPGSMSRARRPPAAAPVDGQRRRGRRARRQRPPGRRPVDDEHRHRRRGRDRDPGRPARPRRLAARPDHRQHRGGRRGRARRSSARSAAWAWTCRSSATSTTTGTCCWSSTRRRPRPSPSTGSIPATSARSATTSTSRRSSGSRSRTTSRSGSASTGARSTSSS